MVLCRKGIDASFASWNTETDGRRRARTLQWKAVDVRLRPAGGCGPSTPPTKLLNVCLFPPPLPSSRCRGTMLAAPASLISGTLDGVYTAAY